MSDNTQKVVIKSLSVEGENKNKIIKKKLSPDYILIPPLLIKAEEAFQQLRTL